MAKQPQSKQSEATEFLRTKLESVPAAPLAPPPPDIDDPDAYLAQVAREQKTSEKEVARLHRKAERDAEADLSKKEQIEKQEEADAQKAADRQKRGLQGAAQDTLHTVSQNTGMLADKVGAMSTVGGIGLLVAILIFLLFVLVPVNAQGDTRLKLLWYMLNGKAVLQGRVTPTGVNPAGTSSSSGTPSTPPPAAVGGGAIIAANPDGSCPTGYAQVVVSGGKVVCQAVNVSSTSSFNGATTYRTL
jgi:hypothetical protein